MGYRETFFSFKQPQPPFGSLPIQVLQQIKDLYPYKLLTIRTLKYNLVAVLILNKGNLYVFYSCPYFVISIE